MWEGRIANECPNLLRVTQAARDEVAALIGAKGQDVVPVVNATAAANIVINGLGLRRGDLLLMTNLTYPAVRPAPPCDPHRHIFCLLTVHYFYKNWKSAVCRRSQACNFCMPPAALASVICVSDPPGMLPPLCKGIITS